MNIDSEKCEKCRIKCVIKLVITNGNLNVNEYMKDHIFELRRRMSIYG